MKVHLNCKDHTVSNENFELLYDDTLDMLITSPQPSIEGLSEYYESENYISHTDSNKSFLDKIYQIVKKHTIKRKLVLIDKNSSFSSKKRSILDVGCGTGDFLSACKEKNWNITGVEPNSQARSRAELKLDSAVFTDISALKGEKFDCITMWHVLEHVPDIEGYIVKIKQLLQPGGTLIIAVPNFKSFDASYYKEYWAGYDVPRHLWHFSKTSIRKLFHMEHMEVKRIIPMKFDAFYVSMLSEKYKYGSTNLLKAFGIGFLSNLKAILSKEYSSLIYVIKNF